VPLTGEKKREYMRKYNREYRSVHAVMSRQARVLRNSKRGLEELRQYLDAVKLATENLRKLREDVRVVANRSSH
jgi:hypothetical protein